MHELSIAHSLIDVVTEHLITSGARRATRVVVEVGELSGVVPAALRSAFSAASRAEPGLEDIELVLRPVAVTLDCGPCGGARPAVGVSALRCAVCNTPSGRVVRGKELDVVAIEVNDAAANA